MTEEEIKQRENDVRLRLTDEFLATLVEAAQVHGHSSDWVVVEEFVESMFDLAGKELPKLTPYTSW